MTLVDLGWLVAGVAFGLAAASSMPGLPFLPPPAMIILLGLSGLGNLIAVAASTVALGRAATYRRMPRSAEWLAILVAMAGLAGRPELNVDHLVNLLFAAFPSWVDRLDFDGWRWLVGWIFTLAIVSGLAVLRAGRPWFPPWAKSLILAGLALLALAGPLWVFGFLGDDLVSPAGGFGGGTGSTLHRLACGLFGHFPTGLLFGPPAIAALGERIGRRPWSWVEWTSLAGAGLVGPAMVMLYQGEFPDPSAGWVLERLLILGWFMAVTLTSRFMLIRFGPAWRGWLEGPAARQVPTSPDPA